VIFSLAATSALPDREVITYGSAIAAPAAIERQRKSRRVALGCLGMESVSNTPDAFFANAARWLKRDERQSNSRQTCC
jgi:hypothetical protein